METVIICYNTKMLVFIIHQGSHASNGKKCNDKALVYLIFQRAEI